MIVRGTSGIRGFCEQNIVHKHGGTRDYYRTAVIQCPRGNANDIILYFYAYTFHPVVFMDLLKRQRRIFHVFSIYM